MEVNGIGITWLGHSTFLLRTPEGKQVLVDPWTRTSPVCPPEFHDVKPDAILVTHGHNDHIGDLVDVAKSSGATVVGIWEVVGFAQARGVTDVIGMNKGGTIRLERAGISVTMTNAHHSASFSDENGQVHYLGESAGFVVAFSNGARLYISGDTCLFGDMALIQELWQPDFGILCIGDHFTMDPRQAAYACKLLGLSKVIGCHYGTFPVLTGTPDALAEEIGRLGLSTQVVKLEIGV